MPIGLRWSSITPDWFENAPNRFQNVRNRRQSLSIFSFSALEEAWIQCNDALSRLPPLPER